MKSAPPVYIPIKQIAAETAIAMRAAFFITLIILLSPFPFFRLR